jgi:hypothetical protein
MMNLPVTPLIIAFTVGCPANLRNVPDTSNGIVTLLPSRSKTGFREDTQPVAASPSESRATKVMMERAVMTPNDPDEPRLAGTNQRNETKP